MTAQCGPYLLLDDTNERFPPFSCLIIIINYDFTPLYETTMMLALISPVVTSAHRVCPSFIYNFSVNPMKRYQVFCMVMGMFFAGIIKIYNVNM